ncbi:oligosaccharyltransferase complex subunit epsilon [Metschnikowia aff. pulcherrima]|uniref:Dolichyl-diphosphooligosaccharide--protein glycosyltransferase subunit OST2 n=1 Tax=Metschnikowia aff. pulcherrima TaxID=2163413 RepID=A0A4P6XP64_9ASCO|nr:oligosaccharyltransferase complex subunit epsilon [Metschnikowia aff. pulcherrima]
MAKKESAVKKAAAAVAAKHAAAQETVTESLRKTTVANPNSKVAHSFSDVGNAVNATYKNYCQTLTPRLKLIDIFLVFLVALGGLQFVYVLLVGNFPFNAFLGGFIACVGQFVLTVSLRMQYASADTKDGKKDDADIAKTFPTISPERAFGDFIFASLILHFIVFHFIN